jgi:uncharacterized FlgJ-related protein
MAGKVNLSEIDSDETNVDNSKSKFTQNKRLDLNDLLERKKVKKSQDLRNNITLFSAVTIILIIVGISVLAFL